jgi:uncharacterized protein (DUF362 family)
MKNANKILLIILGFASTIWFIVRVIPKPSRANYPCQRAALPFASGFILWLIGLVGSIVFLKNFKNKLLQKKYFYASLLIIPIAISLLLFLAFPVKISLAYTPSDLPNKPIGEAKGIFPGRVVWSYNPEVATWDGKTGHWWDAHYTNQVKVNQMLSSTLQQISGMKSDKDSWIAIFKYFNANHNKGNVGYHSPEKIVVKVNMNTSRKSYDGVNTINASPQVILAMLHQLVMNAGVPDTCISVLDGVRHITDNIYDLCHSEFPGVKFVDGFGEKGRIKVQWKDSLISYAVANECGRGIATCITEASYIVNMAILKGHNVAGVTLCAKNHFGSINGTEHIYIRQYERGMGIYNPLVDLMGHKDLGMKTVLFMIDGIYGSKDADPAPEKWKMAPFNDGWPSSIFVSLDNIAIESVGWDFLNTEIGAQPFMKYSDNYLREASQADNPPSKSRYAPNMDNVVLKSLGVHEHWNNPIDKEYSRNLGTGNGIELVKVQYEEVIQIDVNKILNARSVTTLTEGKLITWTKGIDGNGEADGYLTISAAVFKGDQHPKALADNPLFSATAEHPEILLHYSNNDSVSNQTLSISGAGSFDFQVPSDHYTKFFLALTSSEGASKIKVDLIYTDSKESKSFDVPDYYMDIPANDTNACYLVHDLAKWGKKNNMTERDHHNIDLLNIHPNPALILTRIHVQKTEAGYIVFWAATGVAVK